MIFVLTAVHNRREATLEFLGCLAEQSEKNYSVVIVDDGSTDNSARIIKQRYPKTVILHGDGNLWWTGAVNKGLRYILKKAKNGDFILIINNDVVVEKNYLNILEQLSLQNGRAIVGSLCKDYQQHNKIVRGGLKFDSSTATLQEIFPKNKEAFLEVDTLATRGVLVPIEVIRQTGLFDQKNFPHYVSDYDYFLRAGKLGFKLLLSTKAVVYNRTDLTGFRAKEKRLSIEEVYTKLFSIRSAGNLQNTLRFNWKHAPTLWLKIFSNLKFLGWTAHWVADNFL